ncbi:MAG: hypothetical protein ACRD3E_13835 [Terriglobales bacterium]
MNLLVAILLALSLAQDAAGPNLHDIIQNAFHNQERNQKQAENYNYQERSVVRTLDGDGSVKKTEVRTFDVLWIEGSQQRRLIARDDQPLSADEARKVEQEFDKASEKRRNESDSERQKRLKKQAEGKQKGEELIRAVLDAYDFRFAGHDTVSGIACFMIDATPRPSYKGHDTVTNLLKHISGRMWITEDDNELVKVDAIALDNIRFGWFLATVGKGTHLRFEQVRINNEVWLPSHAAVKVSARALFKKLNIEQETSYSGYKKFRVDTKVTGMTGAEPR